VKIVDYNGGLLAVVRNLFARTYDFEAVSEGRRLWSECLLEFQEGIGEMG